MTRLPILILAATILMAPIAAVYGQQAVVKDKVVGNWKLLSFFDESVGTGKKTNVLGENPRGRLILFADGQIALLNVDRSRKSPQGPTPTDIEAAGLFNTMIAYVGRYEIDPTPTEAGFRMTIRSEIASNPRTEGLDRKFIFRMDGDKLIFKTTPPANNPVTGEMSTRNVVWERDQ
jgi:hypothetical protein